MTFQEIGGAWQMKIDGEAALARIHEVDPARWAVTSLPTGDLQCDPGFIAVMDSDKKGRILVSRVIEMRDWTFKHLKGRGRLGAKVEDLRLEDIDTSHADGQMIRKAAERILREGGSPDTAIITLTQVRDYRAGYAKLLANGDGLICAENNPEPPVAEFIKDIIATIGGDKEASGNQGAGLAHLDKFLAQAKAYDEWRAKGMTPDGVPSPAVFPWGDSTEAAATAVKALDAKIEHYFWQCDLVRQDPAALARLRFTEDDLKQLSILSDPAAIEKKLAESPIAEPRPDGQLLFSATLNPIYEADLRSLLGTVLARALGKDAVALNRDGWRKVKAIFDSFNAWRAAKPPEPFEKLDPARLREYQAGPLADRFRHFISIDLAAAPEVAQSANLEKLILLQRWLAEFTNNFVNLSALYDPAVKTMFELGAIVIDGRRLEVSLRVADRAAHKKIATESRIFLVYAEIKDDPAKPALYEVAAPVTKGERGRLIVGKRGVFYSVCGKVYDATIVDVVEHPISIVEAVKAPFRRIADFVGKKIEEFAAKAQASAEAGATAGINQAGTAAAVAKPGEPPKKMDPAAMAGIFATAGLALAAIGSAAAVIVSALSRVSLGSALAAVFAIIGVIVLISAFVGWLKLRMRNLGPVFEANGWAVNPQMKVGGPLAGIFTRRPALPKGHDKDRSNLLKVTVEESEEEFDWAEFFLFLYIIIFIVAVILSVFYPTLLNDVRFMISGTRGS